MPNVEVTLDRIDVNLDGEKSQKGKVYWKLSVNGDVVSERHESNPVLKSSGEAIELNEPHSVELDSDEDLVISGFIAEVDSFTSGKDEFLPISRTHDRSQNWGAGDRYVREVDRGFDCTLRYTIVVE